jgi:hypothetical protein
MVCGTATTKHGVSEQRGVSRGFEIGRNLQGYALLRAAQQSIRQAEDAGSVGDISIKGDAEQETDDQAHPTQRQANVQQSISPARPLRQRINIDIDDVSAISQVSLGSRIMGTTSSFRDYRTTSSKDLRAVFSVRNTKMKAASSQTKRKAAQTRSRILPASQGGMAGAKLMENPTNTAKMP